MKSPGFGRRAGNRSTSWRRGWINWQPPINNPGDFDRQYVGIEAKGKRLIYINAFRLPSDSNLDPARTAIRVCDGGAGFWGAVYDPQVGKFSDVEVNGPG